MSELKIYKQSDILRGHWFTEYCRKDEADKVIAEKDKVIAELKSDIADLRDDKKSTDAILDERNAEIAELKADKTFVFGEECEAYKKSEADNVIADLEESHKKEVGQLLMKIAGLEKLVETADKLVKQKGGFTVKDIAFKGVKLEGVKND